MLCHICAYQNPLTDVGENAVKLVHDVCRCSGMHGRGLRHPYFVPSHFPDPPVGTQHTTPTPGVLGGPSVGYTSAWRRGGWADVHRTPAFRLARIFLSEKREEKGWSEPWVEQAWGSHGVQPACTYGRILIFDSSLVRQRKRGAGGIGSCLHYSCIAVQREVARCRG